MVALLRLEDVLVQDTGRPRVRQDVGIARRLAPVRERPLTLRAAGVVVVNKGHRPPRLPADQAWWLALAVLQPVDADQSGA